MCTHRKILLILLCILLKVNSSLVCNHSADVLVRLSIGYCEEIHTCICCVLSLDFFVYLYDIFISTFGQQEAFCCVIHLFEGLSSVGIIGFLCFCPEHLAETALYLYGSRQ